MQRRNRKLAHSRRQRQKTCSDKKRSRVVKLNKRREKRERGGGGVSVSEMVGGALGERRGVGGAEDLTYLSTSSPRLYSGKLNRKNNSQEK